ncbi:amino acid transporter AVT1I-like [Triticum aestivum]|nr:amino acid transporter AVT1I-like [Triticum aestivum]
MVCLNFGVITLIPKIVVENPDGEEPRASPPHRQHICRSGGCRGTWPAGFELSLALFALVGAVCYYTGTLIALCMRADGSVATYPDVGQLAFGAAGRRTVAVFMYVELYLVAISFLVLEGDNLDKLFPGAGVELLVASAALTASLVWAGVSESGFGGSGNVLNLAGLPTSLGLYFVCFTGHAVFPTIYSSMKNRERFSQVLHFSSVLCSLNYGLTAVLDYLIYGDNVQSQVTLDLPSGRLYTKIAIVMTLVNPLTKYALLVAPITSAIEETFSLVGSGSARVAVSTALLVSTVAVASMVPFFGFLMSFIGSFLSVIATVFFPCLCYLKIYRAKGLRRVEVAAIVAILLLGAFVAITGTYTSLLDIIGTF